MTNKITEQLADRAAVIWKRALANPIYRNTTPRDSNHAMMERVNAMIASLPKNNTDDILDAFGVALKDILLNGAVITYRADEAPILRHTLSLCVDYHEDLFLREAAKRSGLKMEFPIKTTMQLYGGHVSYSMGYGSPYINHYPMPNGKWLVTTLRGEPSDIEALIDFVQKNGAGALSCVRVED